MREILFRGKQKYNGEWVEGAFLKDRESAFYICPAASDITYGDNGNRRRIGCWYAVIPETVGQYTGLTDKNGKKIFEGDIVNVKSLPFGFDLWGYVFFEKNSYKVKTLKYSTVHLLGEISIENDMGASIKVYHEYEVIGNIHDNPELLKEGADNG